jgi:hypothetical protein
VGKSENSLLENQRKKYIWRIVLRLEDTTENSLRKLGSEDLPQDEVKAAFCENTR